LRQLFANDHGRGERLTCEAAGVYLDYSKNRITDRVAARGARAARYRMRRIGVLMPDDENEPVQKAYVSAFTQALAGLAGPMAATCG
jgi:hypothetical protein